MSFASAECLVLHGGAISQTQSLSSSSAVVVVGIVVIVLRKTATSGFCGAGTANFHT